MRANVNLTRRHFIQSATIVVVGADFGWANCARAQFAASRLPVEGKMPSLGGAALWLNSQPLTASGLRGKVVLVDFWTYTCINWRRTFPYIRAWANKYRDHGLVVIGVHTPEFSFEHDAENVRWAAQAMKMNYAIAVDSEYTIWRAFENEYWPALYLIDAQGRIRYHKFGEGEYEQTERVIQELLGEAGEAKFNSELAPVDCAGLEVPADWGDLKSPESYVGYAQSENFVSRSGDIHEKPHVFAFPDQLKLNHWALDGNWIIGKEAIVLNAPNGRIAYESHARDLHLVMGPKTRQERIRFQVSIDGNPPGDSHGTDIDAEGNGVAVEPTLYQLIRQQGTIVDRRIEIRFLDSQVEVFDFTFG
jgi:thiol-disulfide isomerase/thioredoxin